MFIQSVGHKGSNCGQHHPVVTPGTWLNKQPPLSALSPSHFPTPPLSALNPSPDHLKGVPAKTRPPETLIALNPKCVKLKSWNFTNLFIWSAKQDGEVSAF